MDHAVASLTLLLFAAAPSLHAASLASKAEEAVAKSESFVAAENGARFLPAELRFGAKLASPDISAVVEPAVSAIADFAAQLKSANVQLAVVPVPPRVMLEASALGVPPEEQQQMREGWQAILSELSAKMVDVVDLAADFAASPENAYCVRDTHWSGPGIDIAASKIVPRLTAACIAANWPPGNAAPLHETVVEGDLGGEPEKVKLRVVSAAGRPENAARNPVLLLGDSHLFVFHRGGEFHATGAGLPDQLAAATGSMPDVLAVLGSGATSSRAALARRVRADAGYLGAKKIVVWVFAGREFTEADSWKKIPLAGKARAN